MRLKSLVVAMSGILVATQVMATDLSKETAAYKAFVLEQIDQLVLDTEKFVGYLKTGDVQKAKQIYPLARMYFERSEPIAESFGDLDPRIDARLADLSEEGKTEKDWSGFHKIEKVLWEQNTTKGTEATADQLIKDVKELRTQIPTAEVTPELMITGAVDLLNEVSTSKVTGEEEIFSKTDLSLPAGNSESICRRQRTSLLDSARGPGSLHQKDLHKTNRDGRNTAPVRISDTLPEQ